MLRALVLLIVLANAGFWAWRQGWLGTPPRQGEREPARLEAQVRPEALVVMPPSQASAAVQAARVAALVCLEAGPLPDSALAWAEGTLATAQLPEGALQRVDAAPALGWLVYAGRYPEAALRRSREEDLKKLKLTFELIDSPPELAPGLVLSRHPTRDSAEAWLKGAPDGLRGARVVQLPVPAERWTLRVQRADTDTATRLKALPPEALAGGFRPCAAKP